MVNLSGRYNIININASDNRTPNNIRKKRTELKGEIDNLIIIAGEASTFHFQ